MKRRRDLVGLVIDGQSGGHGLTLVGLSSKPGEAHGRTTRHVGYAKSINAGWGIEKVFAWLKAFGGLRQFKLRGQDKVSAVFGLHVIAYNRIRLGNLLKPVMEAA